MNVEICGNKVKVDVVKTSNTLRNDTAFTLRIDGWNILEMSHDGYIRRCGCVYLDGAPLDDDGRVKIKQGTF